MATLRNNGLDDVSESENQNLLKYKNKHPFDSRIKFREEGHKYWIDGDDKDLVSATTFIHQFFDEFDTEKIINKILNKWEYKNNPSYKYYLMKPEKIKEMWDKNRDEASEAGTIMHANIEYFYNDLEVENDSPEFEQFLDFYKDHEDLEMYRTEWMIFSDVLRLTGSIDAVFRNEDGTLSLGDWKRSKEIKFKAFDEDSFGRFPFQNLPDCNFYHYSLQLNLYRSILEKFYNEKIKDMFLVVLHPNNLNNKYQKLMVKRMEEEGDLLLDFRIQQLIKLGYDKTLFDKIELSYRVENVKKIEKASFDFDNFEEEEIERPRLLGRRLLGKKNEKVDNKESTNNQRLLGKKVENKESNNKRLLSKKVENSQKPILIFEDNIGEKNENPEKIVDTLSNKGKKWLDEDDKELMNLAILNKSLKELSENFKRTETSIKLRILLNLYKIKKIMNESEFQEEIKKYPQIELKDYTDFEIKQLEKDKEKESKELTKKEKKELEVQKIQNIEDKKSKLGKLREFEKNKIEDRNKNTKKKSTNMCNLTSDFLSKKQRYAYDCILSGKNILITGPAGTGKTSAIKLFYQQYKAMRKIGITSTTGISAVLIGGSTLHSFLGIGLGKDKLDTLYMNIMNNPRNLKKWRELQILIIDEVSMLSPDLFDKLEHLARLLRKNDRPFGGIQLVLTGDFLQLPCVASEQFCFEAESWNSCVQEIIYLTEIFRQDDDVFQGCLNELRIGKITSQTRELLSSRINYKLESKNGIIPTKIYSLNRDVDEENERELSKIQKKNKDLESFQYDLEYQVFKKNMRFIEDKIKKICIAPEVLELCIGAQVMLLYNIDLEAKLANGSRGVVVGFSEEDLPIVRFLNGEERIIEHQVWKIEDNGEVLMTITQIPLKLAFACTVHKTQGITLDYAEIDLGHIFEYGQAYVALSRVKTLEGLSIKNLNFDKVFAHPNAVEFYEKLN